MNKFKVGARVIVIGDNKEVRKGVIQSLFEEMRLSIVKFDNGDAEKVRFENMYIDPETKAQDEKAQEEKTTEPVEKSEITITPDEFKKICSEAVCKLAIKTEPEILLLGAVIAAEIHIKLFFDAVDND